MDETCGSVTSVLARLRQGDQHAAFEIWGQYFQRLVAVARSRIRNSRQRIIDGEDVASVALTCLITGASDGKFEQLQNRDDLWQMLVVIAVRRSCNVYRDTRHDPAGESVLTGVSSDDFVLGVSTVVSSEPTPEQLVCYGEMYGQLSGTLDDELRRIAELRLQGYSTQEIADRLGIIQRSVQRKLQRIRQKWEAISNC